MVEIRKIVEVVNRQKERIEASEKIIRRELFSEVMNLLDDKRIIILSGMRRAGKSTLLFDIMRELKNKKENFCYINFEEELFLDLKAKDFEKVNEALLEVYGEAKIYFFDEIQNIDNFEAFIRRLHDDGNKIFLTGSNSSLLSKELGTKLSGRYKMFELYPFSFGEFLLWKGYDYEKPLSVKEKVKLKNFFEEYMKFGGVPEYLENKDRDYIKTIYENIIYRDIISRYNIRSQKNFREMVGILSSNISSYFTYNSLKESIKVSNAIVVKEYISYLNNSYLFFELLKFDYSAKKQLNAPRKIYLVDPAFFEVVGGRFREEFGRTFENMIFIELKRRRGEVFYFSKNHECDFLVFRNKKIEEAVQVCFELNEGNLDREISGLFEAMEEFKLREGTIISFDEEKEIVKNNKKIKIIPAYRWLLGKI